MVKWIGAHLTTKNGLHTLQKQMIDLDSETCAFFTGSPRSFSVRDLTKIEIQKFISTINDPSKLLPHAPYVINLANKSNAQKHVQCMQKNIDKLNSLQITNYNFHPGSDVDKLGRTEALKLVANNINSLKLGKVTLIIETMAGDGRKVGSTFEDIRDIISDVHQKDQIGVCIDTCHIFAAGYDIRTKEKFQKVMERFEEVVGLKYLKGMHLNDSKHGLGSKKDRHEELGKGQIGIDCFRYIMNSKYFEDIPMVLETPNPSKYKEELELLRSLKE